ncbi:hypothetical protein KW797_03345, partial [Candidatus Parcubacteria bacterium]|nr:hypothetical protein [Candidatus Parcubacteria bacterium]
MPPDRRIPKSKSRLWSFDTETTGLFTFKGARPFYFAFCNPDGETGRFRWKVDPYTRKVIPVESELGVFEEFFGDPNNRFIMHNAKFDVGMIRALGIEWRAQIEDSYFAAHTLRNNEMTLALKPLCRKYLDFPSEDEKALDKEVAKMRRVAKKNGWKIATEETEGGKPVKADMWLAPDEVLDPYGIGDVERAMLLWKVLEPELQADPVSMKFYRRELELQPVTMAMEAHGVRIRRDRVQKEIEDYKVKVSAAEKILKKAVGPDFNPNSPAQVASYVYEKLKFPVQFWTDTGNPAVHLNALREMDHPHVQALLQYNSHNDAINNFFGKYLNLMVRHEDGYWMLHPDFNQVGPATGRFSCRNPNMQNAPTAKTSRNPYPIEARGPFCPRPGSTWWSYDFSGQEVWIFADGANEQVMLKALLTGADFHADAADYVWGAGTVARELAAGSKVSRGRAKMFLFGTLYGQQDKGAARTLGISKMEAARTRRLYFEKFPRIPEFMDEVIAKASRDGFIQTAWGRKIFVDQGFEYKATNYYVQGTGADVIKDGMLRVDKFLKKSQIDGRIVMTIHDELIVEISDREVSKSILLKIKDILEDH